MLYAKTAPYTGNLYQTKTPALKHLLFVYYPSQE